MERIYGFETPNFRFKQGSLGEQNLSLPDLGKPVQGGRSCQAGIIFTGAILIIAGTARGCVAGKLPSLPVN